MKPKCYELLLTFGFRFNLRHYMKEKDTAIRTQDFEAAGSLRDKEVELKAEIQKITAASMEKKNAEMAAGDGDKGPTVHEAGADTRPLFNSTAAFSDTKYTLDTP
jgi:hypothetical protein